MSMTDANPIDFEFLLDAVPEMLVYHDDKLNVVWANRAASEVAGLQKEEMVGKFFLRLPVRKEPPVPVVRQSRAFRLRGRTGQTDISPCPEKVESNAIHVTAFRIFLPAP
jgi:PAS domain-containing protein